jgi:hypothetical protein
MEFNNQIMDTPEYKQLFQQARTVYPNEYEYLLHVACLSHLMEEQNNIKSDINIENTNNEVQEEHNSE